MYIMPSIKTKGGSGTGAAGFGEQVYGNVENQHPRSMNDNTISMNQVTNGGKRGKKGGKKSVMVPLLLTAANHLVYNRLRKSNKTLSKQGRSIKRGGKRNVSKKRRGGNMINKMVVPTALTTLSYMYGNSKTNSNRTQSR